MVCHTVAARDASSTFGTSSASSRGAMLASATEDLVRLAVVDVVTLFTAAGVTNLDRKMCNPAHGK